MDNNDRKTKWTTTTFVRHLFQELTTKESYFSVYTSLSAAVLRQTLYHSTRLGLYYYLLDKFTRPNHQSPSFFTNTAIGLGSGLAGAFVAVPSDIAMYRMQADRHKLTGKSSKYPHIIGALIRAQREQGYRALWKGSVPTMYRAMIFNVAQLVSYSECKQHLLKKKDYNFDATSMRVCIVAGLVSSLVSTVASMPLDLVKVQMQCRPTGSEYRGTKDVLLKTIENEGILSLWRGFIPHYARQAPLTVIKCHHSGGGEDCVIVFENEDMRNRVRDECNRTNPIDDSKVIENYPFEASFESFDFDDNCFTHCVYKAESIISEDGKLHKDQVDHFFKSNMSSELYSKLTALFYSCIDLAENIAERKSMSRCKKASLHEFCVVKGVIASHDLIQMDC